MKAKKRRTARNRRCPSTLDLFVSEERKEPSAFIRVGRVEDVAPELDEASFDAVLCDPPYGISFMAKGWDHSVPDPDLWREVKRLMKPGAYLMAFGGTRLFHRTVCGIEDAGLEIRDVLMWLYGTGFPKSYNIGNATGAPEWQGYGTALKPGWEPVCLAQRAREGTFAANVLTYGCGGLAIDASRIEVSEQAGRPMRERCGTHERGNTYGAKLNGSRVVDNTTVGRWPANVLVDAQAGAMLDAQAGARRSTMTGRGGPAVQANPSRALAGGRVAMGDGLSLPGARVYGDEGGVSRFYYCPKASRAEREAGLEGLEAVAPHELTGRKPGSVGQGHPSAGAKGMKARKNTHPTVKPIDLIRYLARLILPPARADGAPRRILVPFSGSGSEAIGCLLAGWDEVVGIEMNPEYAAIAEARIAHWLEKGDE